MGQHPIAIRIKVVRPDAAHEEHVVVGVSEAARRLQVSERTVYRMLKSGELERGHIPGNADANGAIKADINLEKTKFISRGSAIKMSVLSDNTDKFGSDNEYSQVENLHQQLEAKDAQIAQLLAIQQELTHTVQRLHEQMYELAHLVLTHNVAAAQAKVEAELKLQQAQNRGGLAGLLGNKGRKA